MTQSKTFTYRPPRQLYRDKDTVTGFVAPSPDHNPIEDPVLERITVEILSAGLPPLMTAVEAPAPAKRGRGRPALANPAPWKAEGVSKATWYARRKREGEK